MNSEVLNIDCMIGMSKYPDKYFELAIVDPPYGIGINMNMGRKKNAPKKHATKQWDSNTPPHTYFVELFRVSKNQIIWGGNYFTLPCVRGWIYWDKDVPQGVSFADGELAWSSFDTVLRKAYIPYSGFNGTKGKIHPTQKPVKLYKWLLDKYAKQGDKILDTHLGSGSSRIACYDYGFDFTGFELDKDYFDAQEKRYKDHTDQINMFKTV